MLEVMPRQTAYPWGVACGGGSLLPLVPLIARLGGHVSIGLGDYPYPELGAPTNADLVSRAVELARENGRQIASIEETRRILRVGR
jgi:uncharacterized protein (DUF849 family)